MAKAANTRTIRQPAAQSAVVKAIVAKTTPGRKAIPSNVITVPGGGAPRGHALAMRHFDAATKESANWRGFFADILALAADAAALKEYRANLAKNKQLASADAKLTGIPITRTAGNRLSECQTVARAAKRGMTMANVTEMANKLGKAVTVDENTVGHATIVMLARRWVDTHDENGAEVEAVGGSKRGAKAKPMIEKVKAYLLNNCPTQLKEVQTLVTALAKRIKSVDDAKAELAKAPAVVKKAADQRKFKRAA